MKRFITLTYLLTGGVLVVFAAGISRGAMETLAQMALYATPDGSGTSLDYEIYRDLWSAAPEPFYYVAGYRTPSGMSTLDCTLVAGKVLVVDDVFCTWGMLPVIKKKAAATYNAKGRITEISQMGKDPGEPNDVIKFFYDEDERLVRAEVYRQTAKKKEVRIEKYDKATPLLYSVPGRIEYTDMADVNDILEIQTIHNTEERLISVIYNRRPHDHIGQFNLLYDPQGRLIMISSLDGKGDDVLTSIHDVTALAALSYGPDGQLTSIHDVISDCNILEWERQTVSDTERTEEIRIRPVLGDANESVLSMTVTDDGDNTTYGGDSVVTVPEDGGLVTVRDWTWYNPEGISTLHSADVTWIYPAATSGDPNLSNRVMLPVLMDDGRLAGILNAKEISICSYASRARPKGGAYALNGSSRDELHFYISDGEDNDCDGMVTMDEYGNAIVSIGREGELAHFSFYVSWPAKKKESEAAPVQSELHDAWNYTNNPARFDFYEAWADSWGIEPYIPVYSETDEGEVYIAGTVTPRGAYCYFQYGDDGKLEAMVRMNSVDPIACTAKKKYDTNMDCRIDMRDLARIASEWMECGLEAQAACW